MKTFDEAVESLLHNALSNSDLLSINIRDTAQYVACNQRLMNALVLLAAQTSTALHTVIMQAQEPGMQAESTGISVLDCINKALVETISLGILLGADMEKPDLE